MEVITLEKQEFKCDSCDQWFKFVDNQTEVECEDCGTHDAIDCPNCGKVYDLIYLDISDLEVREIE